MRRMMGASSRIIIGIVIVGGSLAFAGVASAEQEIQQTFQLGIEHFRDGRPELALELFDQVYAAHPAPLVLYNIALCYQALNRIPEAVNAFRQYLVQEDADRIDAQDLSDIRQTMAELRPQHGDLDLRVAPSGVAISVDEREIGSSPLGRPYAVEPGDHRVSLRLEGFAPFDRTIHVNGGATAEIGLQLAPLEPEPPMPDDGGGSVDDVEGSTRESEAAPLGWWFWTPLALSAGAAVAMAVTGGLALRYSNQYNDSQCERCDFDAYDSGTSLALTTDVLLGVVVVSAAIALIGLIIHYVRRGRSRDQIESSSSSRTWAASLGWLEGSTSL